VSLLTSSFNHPPNTTLIAPQEKNPLGRPRRRCEDNIRMDLREIWWGGDVDWMHLTQDRYQWRGLLNTVMNLRVL
jgi:hypothetical protein